MPVIEVTYYQAVCDCCGINQTAEGDEYQAWSDPGTPADEVTGCGGRYVRGLLICVGCVDTYRETLAPCEADLFDSDDDLAEFAAAGWFRREAAEPPSSPRRERVELQRSHVGTWAGEWFRGRTAPEVGSADWDHWGQQVAGGGRISFESRWFTADPPPSVPSEGGEHV